MKAEEDNPFYSKSKFDLEAGLIPILVRIRYVGSDSFLLQLSFPLNLMSKYNSSFFYEYKLNILKLIF